MVVVVKSGNKTKNQLENNMHLFADLTKYSTLTVENGMQNGSRKWEVILSFIDGAINTCMY